MSGVLVLFTDVFSKCMNHYSFPLFSFHQLEFHIVSMCVSQLSLCCQKRHVKFVFMIMVHFQVLHISSMLSQDPPGAFPDGLQNSYLSLKWHRCQARAHLQGTQEWGLGTSLSPRTKEQLLEVISVFLNQLYLKQTQAFFLFFCLFKKSGKLQPHLEIYTILSFWQVTMYNSRMNLLFYLLNIISKGKCACNEVTVKEFLRAYTVLELTNS